MTEIEARNFIDSKIKQLFPQWEPTDLEYSEWLKRLLRYDFQRATKSITNFVFERNVNYKTPPAGKIFALLKATAIDKSVVVNREPLLVYEIIKKGKKRGYKFSIASGIEPTVEQCKALEVEAANICQKMNISHGCENYIKWHFEAIPF